MHKSTLPDTSAMEGIFDRYISKCHAISKHKKKTLKIIAVYNRLALKRFDEEAAGVLVSNIDLWQKLSARKPNPKSTAGATGANIKAAFRDFMILEQGGKCCYCQRWLFNIAHAKPIEHILPRRNFVQYSFNFWNLAIACFDCNHEKSDQVWSEPAKIGMREYPNANAFHEMFHPRFHNFGEHVRFLRIQTNDCSVTIYIGISDQGRKLCRDLLKIVSAKEIAISGKPNIKAALDTISHYGTDSDHKVAGALDDFSRAFSNIAKQALI